MDSDLENEILNINKEILTNGLFSHNFETDNLEQNMSDINVLENKKKELLKKRKKPVMLNYKDQWTELDSEYKLNDFGINKIENYKSYRDIYDRKFELIKDDLSIVRKEYDGEKYDYLIRKI
jgi:hypothetical protein